jgi:hypothetical protein
MVRSIKTPEELREFLLAETAKHMDCKDSYFGGIYWHEPDEAGCNWQVSTSTGKDKDWSKCIEHILPFVRKLREDYNILDPE